MWQVGIQPPARTEAARHQSIKTVLDYDRVFTPSDGQESVFEECQPLVTSVLDGYNVCIFAYGQTGSGKTHTMQGPEIDPGVSFRSAAELFRLIREERQDYDYYVTVSLFEIYNEELKDLLADPKVASSKKYEIKMGEKGYHIPELKTVRIHSHRDVVDLMAQGLNNRSVGRTNVNEVSSRSHCVLTIYVEGLNHTTGLKSFGKLHLVDLACSERL